MLYLITSPSVQPAVAGEDCNNAPSPILEVGEGAFVVTETGVRLRSQPSTNANIITVIPLFNAISIEGGPECHEGYRWWYVAASNETATGLIYGWVVDGSGCEYWIEWGDIGEGFNPDKVPVRTSETCGGSGDSNDDGGTVTASGSTHVEIQPDASTQEFDWVYLDFDYMYHFEFDVEHCLILNGSEIVAAEIERFSFWLSEIEGARAKTQAVLDYFMPTTAITTGDVEGFRNFVATNLSEASYGACSETRIRYQIGNHVMDLSGLGNIVFGFYMQQYNRTLEDIISNLAQAAKRETWLQLYDNPDDVTQRDTGRSIAVAIGYNASPSVITVENAADENNLE